MNIIRTLAYIWVIAIILFILATSQGCSRNRTVIILKHPSSVEYSQLMEVYR